MAAVFTRKEKSTGELEVTISGEEWEKAVDKAFKKLSAKISIDGFRKGQAPKKILDKYIPVNERRVQAVEDNMNTWLIQGMTETGVEPISRPDVDIKAMDESGATLVYKFQVMPEVTMGNYVGLDYKVEEATVTDEELDAELKRMLKTYAEMEVIETEAQEGDSVIIDYQGLKDGVAFNGGTAEDQGLVLGSHSFIPGFEEQLVGTKAGEEKELNLTFPEDYFSEDLRGADVVFKVKVKEVKREILPELDDDFAKDTNIPGVETVDQLKEKVKERLAESKKASAERSADEALLNEIRDAAEVEIPEVLVQEEEQNMVNEMAGQIQQFGMSFNDYLKAMGKTIEEVMKDYEEQATKNVKARLALEEIAKKEELAPTDEKIESEYNRIAEQYGVELQQVKDAINRQMIERDLQNEMAFEFVKEKANKSVVKPEEKTAE